MTTLEKMTVMDYLDIKYALARKGYSLTAVSKKLGLAGPQSISQVLQRKYWSKNVERSISRILGIPAWKLYPDRYMEDGRLYPDRDKKGEIMLCEICKNPFKPTWRRCKYCPDCKGVAKKRMNKRAYEMLKKKRSELGSDRRIRLDRMGKAGILGLMK